MFTVQTKKTTLVVLSQKQLEFAAGVAATLHDSLRAKGVRDGHGLKNATTEMESGGAAAELAMSLLFRVEWTACSNPSPMTPDIGLRTQVRSTQKPRSHHHLIIRQKDLSKYGNVPFILVVQNGSTFDPRGWIMSHDAIKAGRLWDGGDRSRPEAFFVPEGKLLSISELEDV